MSSDGGGCWQVDIVLPAVSYLPEFDVALEALGGAVIAQEIDGGPCWSLTAHCAAEPDRATLEAGVGAAAARSGIDPPPLTISLVPDTDWVAEYRRRTLPVTVGSFFVYPSHYEGDLPAGRIGIRLDAGLAFGTGEHESTQGCLLALDKLHGKGVAVARALDVGCGSAILSIAMAKRWPAATILAVDNDPDAVRTAAQNVVDNRCAEAIAVAQSDGYRADVILSRAPYDLIAANILARPLITMAPETSAHLASSGCLILSGLLSDQASAVQAAHETEGLKLMERLDIGNWVTLTMRPAR